ncbi:hypothetical protein D3C75_1184280 [compost metagenome]
MYIIVKLPYNLKPVLEPLLLDIQIGTNETKLPVKCYQAVRISKIYAKPEIVGELIN